MEHTIVEAINNFSGGTAAMLATIIWLVMVVFTGGALAIPPMGCLVWFALLFVIFLPLYLLQSPLIWLVHLIFGIF